MNSLFDGYTPRQPSEPPKRLVDIPRAEEIADDLMQKLSNPDGLEFYYLVAYYLPEADRVNLMEISKKKRAPARYFATVAKQLLIKRGVQFQTKPSKT
jgi:hypothetical protein